MSALNAPDAPTGDEAFATLALAWLLELDVVSYLHSAVQAAYQDAYAGAHLDTDPYAPRQRRLTPYQSLPGTAFSRNYDDFHLIRWQSNLAGREQMLRDFPQLESPLPQLADMPASVQEQVGQLVQNRRELPVIMRKDPLVEYGEMIRASRTPIKPLPPLRPSLGEDAPAI